MSIVCVMIASLYLCIVELSRSIISLFVLAEAAHFYKDPNHLHKYHTAETSCNDRKEEPKI